MCPPSAAPCPPSQLNVSVNCAYNSAMLTWNSSPNAVSYTGKAVSTDGHTVMCEAGMNLGCQLTGLQCGKEYTFTVSASDGDCESSDSEPVMDTTGEHAYLLSSYSLLWPILTNPYQRLPIIFYWTSSSPLFSWFYSFPSLRPEWIAKKTFFPPTTTSFLWTKFPPKHYLTIPKIHLAGACNIYLQRAITHYSWMLQHSLAIGVASFPFRTENRSKLAFDFCHQKTKAGSEILLDSLQPQICISGLSAKLFFKATNNICLLFQPRVLLKMCSTPWTVAPTS